jgi:hypothetical protein
MDPVAALALGSTEIGVIAVPVQTAKASQYRRSTIC